MRLRWKEVKWRGAVAVATTLSLCLAACSEDKPGGTINLTVIQPTGGRCQYSIGPVPVQTLNSIVNMSGKIGSVVVNSSALDASPDILTNATGFSAVNVQFGNSGINYYPLDYGTLFAFSYYYAIETGYLLFASLDPTADLATLVPNLSDTLLVYDAHASSGSINSPDMTDNAAYYSTDSNVSGQLRNYILSFPTQTSTDVPLGINLGIMVHEFTHFVFNYLYEQPRVKAGLAYSDGKPSKNAVKALNEGLADYFGFVAAGDPSFFLCSFPQENRDLSVFKGYTDKINLSISSGQGFDPHVGGAVWAAAQYEIGNAIQNHKANAQSLIKLMQNLASCAGGSASAGITVDLFTAARCHMNVLQQSGDSRSQSAASTVYAKYGLVGSGGLPQ
jgi:hypothetical protein